MTACDPLYQQVYEGNFSNITNRHGQLFTEQYTCITKY